MIPASVVNHIRMCEGLNGVRRKLCLMGRAGASLAMTSTGAAQRDRLSNTWWPNYPNNTSAQLQVWMWGNEGAWRGNKGAMRGMKIG